MSKPKIGFIGLGLMGSAMVECLQKNDYDVIVLGNRDRTGIDAAIGRGASEAANARELTEGADIVMFCMGTSEHVEGRVYGDDGVLAGVKPDQIVIDFGTSLPGSTQKIGAALAEKGAVYLDAPLGRTPAQAKDGLLNIMCAGDMAAYERAKPVLDVLGENVFHLGALGAGHTVKLINNFFGMTTAVAMAEAFSIADAAGVDRKMLHEVMSSGPLNSAMMGFINAYASEGQHTMGFAIMNAAKDVGYYRKMAADLGAQTHISPGTDAALSGACETGYGEKMVPEMVDYLTESMRAKA